MSTGELALAGFRALHLAGLLSAFGTLVFLVGVLPRGMGDGGAHVSWGGWRSLLQPSWPGLTIAHRADVLRRDLHRLARYSILFALAVGAVWFVVQAAAIGGTQDWRDTLAVLKPVALDTRFGQIVLLRGAVLLATLPLIGRVDWLAAVIAGLALVLQGAIGHAGATGGITGASLLTSEALHLLAAGAWLGALVPLVRGLAVLPPATAAFMCRRFSPLGMAAVLILAGSGLFQGLTLIGSLPALVGTAYGQTALVKLGLFAALLVLAAFNRLTLTDRLATGTPERAGSVLRWSILAETALALMVVSAASVMASRTPAIHAQPLWPFPWQISLAALDDPDLRREVETAALMVAVTAGLMAASLFWRRGRFLAGIALVAVVAIRLPSFALLLVPAYPTSFYTSPTGFAASTIVQGQALFTANCVSCHGAGGQGDGPGAADARVRPADLTAPHLLEHPDGELFWWLTHGMEDPEGGLAMPGFAGVLTDAERWALIDFIRARNLGVALRRTGAWPQPTPAPSLPITCANPAIAEMAELRGKVVAVVANGPGIPTPRADGVTVLNLVPGQGHAACTAETEDAWQAYAILTGVPPRDLAGSVILVDPDGWLRAVRHGDIAPNWNDPDLLRAEVRQIREHPISTPSGGSHDHHH